MLLLQSEIFSEQRSSQSLPRRSRHSVRYYERISALLFAHQSPLESLYCSEKIQPPKTSQKHVRVGNRLYAGHFHNAIFDRSQECKLPAWVYAESLHQNHSDSLTGYACKFKNKSLWDTLQHAPLLSIHGNGFCIIQWIIHRPQRGMSVYVFLGFLALLYSNLAWNLLKDWFETRFVCNTPNIQPTNDTHKAFLVPQLVILRNCLLKPFKILFMDNTHS